ncbi:hypothetical protein [Oleiharenicola sp. Vm1]|uniref:hypothetical protein n=1 Tax=Oleiharenicola sp. Vm1 TaxID=3398393 RepID=UPI0039F471D7
MELRTVLLTLILCLAGAGTALGQVLRYPLDDRATYTVRIGTDAPTTVMFPGPVTALDAAGISTSPEDRPQVLLSHQAGTRFFTVRALRAGATAAANVVFRDRVYALAFTSEGEPHRTVTFYEPTGEPATSQRPRPDRLLALLDLAKNYAVLAQQYPALVQRVERITPNTSGVHGELTAAIEEVFGFSDEDALVLRIRAENRGEHDYRYAPSHLGVRIGSTVFPVGLTDADGVIPAGRAAVFHLVVAGNPDGSQARLSLKNTFAVALPAAAARE